MDEKIKSIINLLLSLTKERKIEWQYANSDDSFKIELNSATLVISYIECDPFTGKDCEYYINMYNGTGKPIELISLGVGDDPDDYQLLTKLHTIAKESTDKKLSTIEKVLDELTLKDLPF